MKMYFFLEYKSNVCSVVYTPICIFLGNDRHKTRAKKIKIKISEYWKARRMPFLTRNSQLRMLDILYTELDMLEED